ncbi:L,D-transpeptidase family protein [Simiduia litorea]|uniref:L,D-transpeptidase family protein n=1 Tax=Simiduia litorea TaxID=1435348 RepID=UPI0036F2E2BA
MRRSLRPTLLLAIVFSFVSLSSLADEMLQQRIEAWQLGFAPYVQAEPIRNSQVLMEFYQANEFEPIWLDQGKLNEQALAFIGILGAVVSEGLLPEDYHYQQFQSPAQFAPIDLELALSDGLLTLASHLLAGKTEATQFTPEWKANPRPRQLEGILPKIAAGTDIKRLLDEARPQQIRYRRLIAVVEQYARLTDRPWPQLANAPSIKAGAKDERIVEIAERLKLLGDLDPAWSSSSYDQEIIAAVKHFQLRHGLKEDGDIGRESFAALNISPAERLKQLVVNLERWRWLDSDLGNTFVVVNIAGFDLRVIADGETIFQQPVIVGRDFRKTPVFSDKIRYLVFNPTWTVPFKLAVEDKLPEIRKNPNYLHDYGFTVYQGGTSDVVDPAVVDWSLVNRRNFNYRFVQAPGPLNALGQVKFMFPNGFDVYLHDTPARELFTNHQRAFSSGCIRVFNPLALAELLLKDDGWNREKIDQLIESRESKTVYLKNPIPVHIEYWTAWVDRSGVINFRNDIYKRDEALYEALIQPLEKSLAITVSGKVGQDANQSSAEAEETNL